MDQYAATFGQMGHALLLDCRSASQRAIPLPADVAIVVIDSGVRRRLAGSGYGERRAACARAVAGIRLVDPRVDSLRDVSDALLEAARPGLDDEAYRRALHVVTENARVLATAEALEARDLAAVSRLFAASHASMRDDFEVSTPELDRLVEIAVAVPGVIGARLTGGGFGGATVNLVRPEAVEALAAAVGARYRGPTGRPAVVRRVEASDGVHLVAV